MDIGPYFVTFVGIRCEVAQLRNCDPVSFKYYKHKFGQQYEHFERSMKDMEQSQPCLFCGFISDRDELNYDINKIADFFHISASYKAGVGLTNRKDKEVSDHSPQFCISFCTDTSLLSLASNMCSRVFLVEQLVHFGNMLDGTSRIGKELLIEYMMDVLALGSIREMLYDGYASAIVKIGILTNYSGDRLNNS